MAAQLELAYLRGGIATYPPGATFGPRLLYDLEVVWILAGQVIYHANDHDYPAPPGTVLLCKPGTRDGFTWDPARTTQHGFFHIDITATPDDWPAIEHWPVAITLPEQDVVRPLLRYVHSISLPAGNMTAHAMRNRTRAVELLLSALLLGPMEESTQPWSEYPEPVTRALTMARDTLHADATRSITLAAMAKAAAVSPEHLCRLFRQSLDTTPGEVVWLLRLEMAMSLMARSNLSLKEIANRCGFANPYHFSRRFKTVYGQPPSDMRKQLLAGTSPPLTRLVRTLRLA